MVKQAMWHIFGALLLGILLALVVWAAKADELAIGWALMEVSAVSSEPVFELFETESGCRIVERLRLNEQGIEAACVPVLVFEVVGACTEE